MSYLGQDGSAILKDGHGVPSITIPRFSSRETLEPNLTGYLESLKRTSLQSKPSG